MTKLLGVSSVNIKMLIPISLSNRLDENVGTKLKLKQKMLVFRAKLATNFQSKLLYSSYYHHRFQHIQIGLGTKF